VVFAGRLDSSVFRWLLAFCPSLRAANDVDVPRHESGANGGQSAQPLPVLILTFLLLLCRFSTAPISDLRHKCEESGRIGSISVRGQA